MVVKKKRINRALAHATKASNQKHRRKQRGTRTVVLAAAKKENIIRHIEDCQTKIREIEERAKSVFRDGRRLIRILGTDSPDLTVFSQRFEKWRNTWFVKIQSRGNSIKSFVRMYPPDWIRNLIAMVPGDFDKEQVKARRRMKNFLSQIEMAKSQLKKEELHQKATEYIEHARGHFRSKVDVNWCAWWYFQVVNLLPRRTVEKFDRAIKGMEEEIKQHSEEMIKLLVENEKGKGFRARRKKQTEELCKEVEQLLRNREITKNKAITIVALNHKIRYEIFRTRFFNWQRNKLKPTNVANKVTRR